MSRPRTSAPLSGAQASAGTANTRSGCVSNTITGFEGMRMIRKRQYILLEPGVTGEVRFVNKLFELAA